MVYYDTTKDRWWEQDHIFDKEDIARNQRFMGDGNATIDFAGLPIGRLRLQDIRDDPKSLLKTAYGLGRIDIDQGISTWKPGNWDFDGRAVQASNIKRAIAEQGDVKVLHQLRQNADYLKPGTLRTAASIGRQAAGKALNTTFSIGMPVLGVASDLSNGINPVEAAIRGGLDLVGSYGGMALGGAVGTAVPVPGSTIVGGIGGSMAGQWLADKAVDFVFGDEDKRIAENQQKKAQEQQRTEQMRAMRGDYLADRYLNPQLDDVISQDNTLYQGGAQQVWGNPWS